MLEFYKDSGLTPLQFINNIKKEYIDKKICYTARLDPMARGIIPILFGEECKYMDKFTNLSKLYEVKVLFGFRTDSDDSLGILENYNFNNHESKYDIEKYKSHFTYNENNENNENNYLSIKQKFHHFSTKALLSRSKNDFEEKYHDVKFFKSKIIDSGELDYKDWCIECIEIINKVDKTKNFRQQEIIDQWKNLDDTNNIDSNTNTKIKIQYITLELNVGSGFFVRQYIRDISDKIGIPLMCYDIHRTKIYYE